MLTKKEFYNKLSNDYDNMINFDSAIERRKILLQNFIDKEFDTTADLGCGSGIDSIALASSGLTVDAFDISDEVLNKAKTKSDALNLPIEYFNYSMQNIPEELFNKYSFVVTLGNSIANIPTEDLSKVFNNIYQLLKTDGKLLIHILNYDKILLEKERIVNITNKDGKSFVRFYDFVEDHLNFNILSYENANTSSRTLITTKLYPHTHEQLNNIFIKCGFTKIEFFGSLDKKKFEKNSSKDLVITAYK